MYRVSKAVILALASLLCIGVFAGSARALGTTHYVAPFGVGLDLNCNSPGFSSIQAAVLASASGDTIVVCDGVYNEQVTVTGKTLSLAGSGNAVIKPPGSAIEDLVTVGAGADVTMSQFVVAGPGSGGCASIQAGIRVRDGGRLDLSNTTIRDIADNPFGGCQNGEGIRVGARGDVGAGGHATIDQVQVVRYQKNGITVNGTGATANIMNTTVRGIGATDVIAQNGIQVSRGASATINTSTIRDNWYTPKTFVACGLLIFDASGVNDDQNVYLNNEKNKCTNSRGGTFEGLP